MSAESAECRCVLILKERSVFESHLRTAHVARIERSSASAGTGRIQCLYLCVRADHADAARVGHPVRGAEDRDAGDPRGPLLVRLPRCVARRRRH